MVAVDVLQVPISHKGNSYLLILQDYFTKWLEAIPMKDQQADTIFKIIIDTFTRFGIPRYLHSDQGRISKVQLLKKHAKILKLPKPTPHLTILREMVW